MYDHSRNNINGPSIRIETNNSMQDHQSTQKSAINNSMKVQDISNNQEPISVVEEAQEFINKKSEKSNKDVRIPEAL